MCQECEEQDKKPSEDDVGPEGWSDPLYWAQKVDDQLKEVGYEVADLETE